VASTKPGAARSAKPVWQEIEEREKHKLGYRVRAKRHTHRRLAVVYDIEAPHVRLGMLWFLVAILALIGGPWALALVYGATAAFAATQTATCLRKAGYRPNREVAGAGALAITLAGAVTTGLVGVAILLFTAVAVFDAYNNASGRRNPVVDAAATVRCGLFVGFAASCMVITDRFAVGGALGLLLLASAYETGDYIVGSGAENPYEGPLAGAIAQLVITFAITAFGIEPFTFPGAFALGAMAAVLCAAGQLLASAILPSAWAPASALRRLDSLLFLAPAWALVIGILVK